MTYTLYLNILSANHDIYFLIQELRADLLRRLLGEVGADAQLQEAPEGVRRLPRRAPTTGTIDICLVIDRPCVVTAPFALILKPKASCGNIQGNMKSHFQPDV